MKLNEGVNKRLDVVLDHITKRRTSDDICREHQVSVRTLLRWTKNYRDGGIGALEPKSKAPKNQSNKTSKEDEELIVKTKLEHPSYGSRMVKHLLGDKINASHVTVNKILNRHNLTVKVKPKQQECKRFERKHPDSLWQMDIYEFRTRKFLLRKNFVPQDMGNCSEQFPYKNSS